MTSARPAGIRRIARIDLDAFASNLADASSQSLDLRADAYGHSISLLGPVARDSGVSSVWVSDEQTAEAARKFFTDVGVGRILHDPAEMWVTPYGLDGGSPVLTLVGEVLALKHVEAGAGVSYGYTYRTAAPSALALVGLGYADGVPRLASNRAQVLLDGRLLPLVGRVAMDQFVVDCGDATAELGAEVVLFGDPASGAPSPPDWATATERTALALTAGLGARIRREARS
jgi:alanine racemase